MNTAQARFISLIAACCVFALVAAPTLSQAARIVA